MIQQYTTFTEFKKNFYSRISDLSLFDCMDFNLLKVVLDGLKVDYYKHERNSRKVFKFLLPEMFLLVRNLWSKLCGYFSFQEALFTGKKYLLIDMGGITSLHGKKVLTFYDNIIKVLGRENCFVFMNAPENSPFLKEVRASKLDYMYDLVYNNIKRLSHVKYSHYDMELKSQLLKTYKRIKTSGIFNRNELYNIAYAIDIFFDNYVRYSNLFDRSNFERAFIICHYHQEAIIYYLKKRKVKLIELQHGLIANSDIFYVFPDCITEVRDKCLFPDSIFVFGKYWKDILLKGFEYTDEKISVIGDFLAGSMSTEPFDMEIIRGKKIILIATQIGLHEHYIRYVKFLSMDMINFSEWIIVVKLHPSELPDIYSSISNLENVIVLKNVDLNQILSNTDILVSIYSTVIFDSLKYSMLRFTLQTDECSDYTRDIIESNIAFPLRMNDNPLKLVDKIGPNKSFQDKSYFYAPFNKKIIEDEIRNKRHELF